MRSLPGGEPPSLQPGEAYQRCLQALGPPHPDLSRRWCTRYPPPPMAKPSRRPTTGCAAPRRFPDRPAWPRSVLRLPRPGHAMHVHASQHRSQQRVPGVCLLPVRPEPRSGLTRKRCTAGSVSYFLRIRDTLSRVAQRFTRPRRASRARPINRGPRRRTMISMTRPLSVRGSVVGARKSEVVLCTL
jgi:hypothetical protein